MVVYYLLHFIYDGKCLHIGIVVITCMSNYCVHVVGRLSHSQLAEERMSRLRQVEAVVCC